MKLKSVIFGLLALFLNLMSGQSQASPITYGFESGLSPFVAFGTGSVSVVGSTLDPDGNTILPYEGNRMAMMTAGDGDSGGIRLDLPDGAKEGDALSFYWRFLPFSDDPLNDPINAVFRFGFGGSGVFNISTLATTSSPGTDWALLSFLIPELLPLAPGDLPVPSRLYVINGSDGFGTGVALVDGVTYQGQGGTVSSPGSLPLAVLAMTLALPVIRKQQPRTRRIG